MLRNLFKILINLVIFSLVVVPTGSLAAPEHINAISVTSDILIFRPVGIALVPVTAVVFALAYPFTLIGNNTEKVFDVLVAENIKYTFKRPLGHDVPIR
jgi:hypothetical protein